MDFCIVRYISPKTRWTVRRDRQLVVNHFLVFHIETTNATFIYGIYVRKLPNNFSSFRPLSLHRFVMCERFSAIFFFAIHSMNRHKHKHICMWYAEAWPNDECIADMEFIGKWSLLFDWLLHWIDQFFGGFFFSSLFSFRHFVTSAVFLYLG